MRLHTKNNRYGIIRGKNYVKIQLGWFRLYLSRIAMKPKYESKLRRGFRREILQRSPCCEICGRPLTLETLSVHHRKSKALYPELMYDMDNCQALCRYCHDLQHATQKERVTAPSVPVVSVPALRTEF